MKKLCAVFLCIGIIFSFTACKKDTPTDKKAIFEHVNLEYDFQIPTGFECVVDNNDKQTVWMYNKGGDPADWQIIITLTPAKAEEFTSFDLNQRALIKSQTAKTLTDGRFLYEYDTNENFADIYSIAEYDKTAECIIFLQAKDSVSQEITTELFDKASVTKTK